jgi:hypothetical protein
MVRSYPYWQANGSPIPLSEINSLSSTHNISLRTGCMCNPGGAATLLESHFQLKKFMTSADTSTTLKRLEEIIGFELGVVRVSMGLGSNWQDANSFVEFAKNITTECGDRVTGAGVELKSMGPLTGTSNDGKVSRRKSWKISSVWKHLGTNRVSRSKSVRV